MTVAYGTAGAVAYGSTSVAPAYPSGITAGDMLVLLVGTKPASATITTSDGSWIDTTDYSGTSGTNGVDTGPTKNCMYYKIASGSESGTVPVAISSGNTSWAIVLRFTKASDKAWGVLTVTGQDTSAGAAYSASLTGLAAGDVVAGDMIIGSIILPTDITGAWSAQTFAGTGLTMGTAVEVAQPMSSTGNDIGGEVFYQPVSSGSLTGTSLTLSGTKAGTTTNVYGPGRAIVLHERTDLTQPLVAYSFDEGTGTTAADSSGNGYDLTVTSGSWGTGHTSGGLVPSSTYPVDRAFGSGTLSAFTVMAWVKLSATPTTYLHVLSTGDDAGAGFFTYGLTDTGKVYAAADDGNIYVEGGTTVAAGVWTHVAVYLDTDGTWLLYVNGVIDGELDGETASLDRALSWSVGGPGDDPTATFTGVIDDFRIFGDDISYEEINYWMGTPVVPTSGGGGGEYVAGDLVFEDHFLGAANSAPDPTKWYVQEDWAVDVNNELEAYTDRTENVHLDGSSNLAIVARDEEYTVEGDTRDYTSGRLECLYARTYGRFEARIKVPYGQGIWPAFWSLTTTYASEIDFMELLGQDTGTVHQSIHTNSYAYSQTNDYAPSGADFSDDFHVYRCDWTAEYIRWFVDDVQVWERTPANVSGTWPAEDAFVLLNVAVGGDWPGAPDGTTTFPQTMLVDYVRVYELVDPSEPRTVVVQAAAVSVAAPVPTVAAVSPVQRTIVVPLATAAVAALVPGVFATSSSDVVVQSPAAAVAVAAPSPSLAANDVALVSVPVSTVSVAAPAPAVVTVVGSARTVVVPVSTASVQAYPPTVALTQPDSEIVAVPSIGVDLAALVPTLVVVRPADLVVSVPDSEVQAGAHVPDVIASSGQGVAVSPDPVPVVVQANAPLLLTVEPHAVVVNPSTAAVSATALTPAVLAAEPHVVVVQAPVATVSVAAAAPAVLSNDSAVLTVPVVQVLVNAANPVVLASNGVGAPLPDVLTLTPITPVWSLQPVGYRATLDPMPIP